MIRRYTICCLAMFLFAGCGSNSNEKKAPAQDQAAADSAASEEPIDSALSEQEVFLSNQMNLANFMKSRKSGFDWKQFQLAENWDVNLSIQDSSFNPGKNFYEAYGKFLKYSPDSSFFVDLDSYNVEIKKDKQGNWIGEEGGPDTQVSLVDRKSHKKMSLLFLGPGGSVEDALWTDNNTILLFGVYDKDGHTVPSVWKFNIPENEFSLYLSNDSTLAARLKNYTWNVRLKGIRLE